MTVSPRQPYAGELVFTAFSGSNQDAIAKGMKYREDNNNERWTVPYLPIDPKDVGRTYDKDVIRINSQSGKGGVSYVLKEKYGITLPMAMRESVGYMIKGVSDKEHKELSPEDIYQIFEDKPVVMEVPVKLQGFAEGVQAGGKLVLVTRKLKVKAVPANLPGEIVVDVTTLGLGKSVKVKELSFENFEVVNAKEVVVAQVKMTRAAKSAESK